MKKKICFLMLFVLGFSLFSCKGTEDSSSKEDESSSSIVEEKEYTVTINISAPDAEGRDAYVTGDMNNWAMEKNEANLFIYDAAKDIYSYTFQTVAKKLEFKMAVIDKESAILNSGDNFVIGLEKFNDNLDILAEYTVTGFESKLSYMYEGTLTVGPYTVYEPDGTTVCTTFKDNTNNKEITKENFETLYLAIHYAGSNSTNSRRLIVKDANGLQIFTRQSKTKYWLFDGEYFVGTKSSSEALEWAKNKSRSYVIDGQGTGYIALGSELMPGTDESQINWEIFSGGYNYMFSKTGEMQNNTWVKQGYGYFSAYVRLSEATYNPSKDGDGWNAYIFVNGAGGYNSDLGLIGNVINGEVQWRLVRNCSHPDHKDNPAEYGTSFTVLSPTPVTTMKYNSEKDWYDNGDDLHFECFQGVDGWTLNITNLSTGVVSTINEHHKDMHAGNTQYLRFLLAASYCPVRGNVWNARNGGFLKNVIFQDIKIAEWNAQEDYSKSTMEEFYPGSANMSHGFSQAADCANYFFGNYAEAGVLGKGNNQVSFAKGDKYLAFSSYYDGSEG